MGTNEMQNERKCFIQQESCRGETEKACNRREVAWIVEREKRKMKKCVCKIETGEGRERCQPVPACPVPVCHPKTHPCLSHALPSRPISTLSACERLEEVREEEERALMRTRQATTTGRRARAIRRMAALCRSPRAARVQNHRTATRRAPRFVQNDWLTD